MKQIIDNIKTTILFIISSTMLLASCDSSNNSQENNGNSEHQNASIDKSALIGTWLISEVELNTEEIIEKIMSSNIDENEKKNARTEINSFMKNINASTAGLRHTFFEDGAIRTQLQNEAELGTYVLAADGSSLKIKYTQEGRESDMNITEISAGHMKWSVSMPMPLDDGTEDHIMGKMTFHFLKVK